MHFIKAEITICFRRLSENTMKLPPPKTYIGWVNNVEAQIKENIKTTRHWPFDNTGILIPELIELRYNRSRVELLYGGFRAD